MNVKKQHIVSGGMIGILILLSAVMVFRASCKYPIAGMNVGVFQTFCFFNWWGILVLSVALFFALSKIVYTKTMVNKARLLFFSGAMLLYALISLALW